MQPHIRSTLIKYGNRVRAHAGSALFLHVAVMAAASTAAIVPLFYKRFFDILTSGIPNGAAVALLVRTLMIIAGLQLLQWAFWRFSTFINNYFQATIIAELADDCFRYLHKHSFAFFNGNFVGSLVKRVNYFTRAFEGTADRLTWNILPLF